MGALVSTLWIILIIIVVVIAWLIVIFIRLTTNPLLRSVIVTPIY